VAEAIAPAAGVATEGEETQAPAPAAKEVLFEEDDEADLQPRAPIVTVMGHVDHGKTSLLDAIRTTEVAAGERGGITQHIGASEIDHGGKRVVFLDTPGHEAFTAMRARGAKVTDIAVVVVAADDGVMPQTLEAISHAKAAKVPIIIALNKIDKADSNPDRVKTELSEAGVIVEEYGGDTPLVPVSARTRVGLDELIEMILLVADLQELKANPKRAAVGTIVEAQLDKNRGAVATAIVQTGTLRVGDVIVVGETFGKVRALEDEQGKRLTKAGPSSAVVVLGLSAVPEAGDILRVVPDEKEARTLVESRRAAAAAKSGEGSGRATLEDLYRQIQAGQAKELRIILKSDVSGSLGAITHALEQLNQDEIRINVLHEGAGDITDNDVMLASASDAIIVGFNTKITETARRAADAEGVDVRMYDIIYKLTDDISAALLGLLEPEIVEVVEGRAEVRQIFRVGKSTVIAGCFVTDGRIVRGGARVWRGGRIITTDRIESLRRFRDDVREVQQNYECGIGLAGFNDLEEGDIIECFTQQTVSRVVA
jgi:translation initiation factor IF-2